MTTEPTHCPHCPHCHADLTGPSIPAKDREHFGGKTHYSRVVVVIDRLLDRVDRYRCPDCGREWPMMRD